MSRTALLPLSGYYLGAANMVPSIRTVSRASFSRIGLAFALTLASLGALGCDSLTAPPEPIAVDNAIAAKPAPRPAASAAPSASAAPAPTPPPPPADPNAKLVTTDISVGKGVEAKTGDTVSVNYTGTLADGKEFDSTKRRNTPFTFTLGQGGVIKGWDQGVPGMKVGGKRKLVIPSQLAYGPMGRPPIIPANATLTFEIELLEIKKK